MNVLSSLARRLSGDATYECVLCTATYDRERLNCPACGSETVQVA